MAETFSNRLQRAVKETIATYGPFKIAGMQPKRVYWHMTAEIIHAEQCRFGSIGILDKGWTKTEETMRGCAVDGTLNPGMALSRHGYEIQVCLKGRKGEDLREQLNEWADGITAIFEDIYDLDGLPCCVLAEAGEPSIQIDEGSDTLQAVAVTLSIDVFRQQGEIELTEE